MNYSIGISYEGQDATQLGLLLPYINHIEISPDSIARKKDGHVFIDPATLAGLVQLASEQQLDMLLHGVGLSIGSYDGYSADYIALADELFNSLDIAWHSEHLAYTMVDGQHLGTMLSLPRTDEVIDMICRRVDTIQRRYKVPFLLENVISMLPAAPGRYSEAAFLNKITSMTGCGLVLDIYNLECDQNNFGFDIAAHIDELDLSAVRELHLAGGERDPAMGFQMDIHSHLVADSTMALTHRVLQAGPKNLKAITFEILKEFLPMHGPQNIIRQIKELNHQFNGYQFADITAEHA